MDAIFIDVNGNKKNFLYQYDKGQSLIIEEFEYSIAPKVQFSIKSIKTAISVQSTLKNGTLKVAIPNVLLTYGEDIITYIYLEDKQQGYVVETIFISVYPRKRPSNYIYQSEMFAKTINGTTISENDGFADVFEWSDGNTSKQNRDGYFVNINSKTTISKATSINNVYGVTVHSPGFASNCTEDKLNNSGNLLPKYAYVCSFGFALVRNDGTCIVGENCVPNASGIATRSSGDVGFKVLAKVDNTYIFIFVDTSAGNIGTINTKLTSHISNNDNPHSVTKAQVGLGNVPNVATNNQTPTYTAASTLSALVSGERLSVTFGKISKAVTDLIAHIANKSNPHSVTKAQIGLGSVNNTSDANKPISTATQTALNEKVDKTDFNALQKRIDNILSDIGFIMIDQSTGDKYTIGMNNGKLVIIPLSES